MHVVDRGSGRAYLHMVEKESRMHFTFYVTKKSGIKVKDAGLLLHV